MKKNTGKKKGQTLIETALILLILLTILIGIAEFARGWFIKNSIKNASRQLARFAAVTPSPPVPAPGVISPYNCPAPKVCPQADAFLNAVCCQPGVPGGATFTLTVTDEGVADGITNSGDTVTVNTSTIITFIIGDSPWPWAKTRTVTADASMRYE